ncbi:MAG: PilZ domain-containing protein [Acidimicrobiales bacterium]
MADVQYLVLPDSVRPYLLARVRWPDVAQAISAGRPYWQHDPGLFDLPYEPSSATVTPAEAALIAASWGARLSDPTDPVPFLFRRMPPNWSYLVPAERHAWSLEFVLGRRGSASHAGRSRSFLRKHRHDQSLRQPELELGGQTTKLLGTPDGEPAPRNSLDPSVKGNGHLPMAASERRRHARVHLSGRAQIRCCHKIISVDLLNISEGGLHLVVPYARSILESGRTLDPPLWLEDRISGSDISLDVASSVSWHSIVGPTTQLGVVFAELNDEQAQQVQSFLATLGPEPGR